MAFQYRGVYGNSLICSGDSVRLTEQTAGNGRSAEMLSSPMEWRFSFKLLIRREI
jgi:hypothetical protein